jgi:hypothetical protein
MNDPIATGDANNGGGQGMSQWGSWEWAEGLSYQHQSVLAPGWQCILDHYYNDNGNATGAGGSNTYRYSFLYGPGGDGKIAFPVDPGTGYYQVYTMNIDGSLPHAATQSSPDPALGGPAWSPDQKTLAYTTYSSNGWNVFTVSTSGNGSNPTPITFAAYPMGYFSSHWSRSGNNLLALMGQNLVGQDQLSQEVYSINASNPGQPTQLTSDFPLTNFNPFWSPDSQHPGTYNLDFGQVGTSNWSVIASENGSHEYPLYVGPPNYDLFASSPGWSPDGSTIVFYTYAPSCNDYPAIYSVNALGGTPTLLNCIPNGYLWSPRYSQDGRYIVAAYWSGDPSSSVTPYVMNADGSGGSPVGATQSSFSGAPITLDVTRCMRLDILQPSD